MHPRKDELWKIAIEMGCAKANGDKYRGTGTRGYVKRDGRHEHRIVMESIIGRPLKFQDVVHHIDGNKHNNHPSNLMLVTRSEHMRLHGLGIPKVYPDQLRKYHES